MNDEPITLPKSAAIMEPSVRGILQCLRMLADEAGVLKLGSTQAALRAAMAVCMSESEGEAARAGAQARSVLH